MAILILWVLGIIDVLKRPDFDRGKRSAWILIIVLLPIIGTIGYFASRPTLPDERDKIIDAQTRGRRYRPSPVRRRVGVRADAA